MSGPSPTVLRLENVTVRFDDAVALDRVNFDVAEGDTCVLLGTAGSGKTVLLKTALGLIRPDEGRVVVFGQDTTGLRERDWVELRSRMGILFQEGGLFDSLTIEENVGYPFANIKSLQRPPEEIRARVVAALEFVELGETLDKLPSELSGGMRRRVGIARAVVTEPALVLYDSPTAGLDPITANRIMALIAKERDSRHAATIVVTHRVQDGELLARYVYDAATGNLIRAVRNGASLSKARFIVLKEGRIVFEGSQEEFAAAEDPYVAKFARR
jgi:phospholipid/cholesterol/gamma-HCH transport system ATP-binding protein